VSGAGLDARKTGAVAGCPWLLYGSDLQMLVHSDECPRASVITLQFGRTRTHQPRRAPCTVDNQLLKWSAYRRTAGSIKAWPPRGQLKRTALSADYNQFRHPVCWLQRCRCRQCDYACWMLGTYEKEAGRGGKIRARDRTRSCRTSACALCYRAPGQRRFSRSSPATTWREVSTAAGGVA